MNRPAPRRHERIITVAAVKVNTRAAVVDDHIRPRAADQRRIVAAPICDRILVLAAVNVSVGDGVDE